MNKLVAAVATTGVLFTGTAAVHVSADEYEVQNNDTLWSIANKYNTSVDNLMNVNELDSTIIHSGQKLSVDSEDQEETYVVEEGDTLGQIAANYDVTVDEIMDWNDLSDTLINIGQELTIKGVAVNQEANAEAAPEPEPEEAVEEEAEAVEEEAAPEAEAEAEEPAEEQNEESTEPEPEAETTSEESSAPASDGESISVTATAYTADCEGCSGVTATGMDLKANPEQKVIAVDPNVIPLGSEVYVEGYGKAVAADTGGAIKGDKIDVHVPNADEANSWGVRTVNVEVLD